MTEEIGDVRYVVALNKSTLYLILGVLCLAGAISYFAHALELRGLTDDD